MRAEWTKLRTVRGWVIGMLAVLVLADIGLFASAGGQPAARRSVPRATEQGGCAWPALTPGPGGEAVTDDFYLVRQALAGDGAITARVTSLTGRVPRRRRQPAGPPAGPRPCRGPRPGSSSRQHPPGAAYAAMMVTGHGVRMQWDYTGDTAGLPGTVRRPPRAGCG